MQERPNKRGVDGELRCVLIAWRRRYAFARRQLQQLVGIDGDRIGVSRRRSRNCGGDDVGLNGEALHPRLDQIGAKLVEQQKPDHEHDKAAQIEDDDAPGERRRKPRR